MASEYVHRSDWPVMSGERLFMSARAAGDSAPKASLTTFVAGRAGVERQTFVSVELGNESSSLRCRLGL